MRSTGALDLLGRSDIGELYGLPFGSALGPAEGRPAKVPPVTREPASTLMSAPVMAVPAEAEVAAVTLSAAVQMTMYGNGSVNGLWNVH